MENEFITAIDELELKDNEILVNLAGGGLNLKKYIKPKINYIALDFSLEWCSYDKDLIYTSYEILPFKNNSVDKIIILAVLHHFTDEERSKLYKECYRILKKTGKLVIADVIKNSNQDIWLNTFVNKYNPFGHKGKFFDIEDKALIESNDFIVKLKNKKYNWWFTEKKELLDYMKNLFHLNISDDILMYNIDSILKPFIINNNYYFEWQLMYFICIPLN